MNGDSVPVPGVFSQQRAISVDPLPRVRAPGSDNSVTSFNTSPAETEDTNNQSHGHPAPQQGSLPSDHHSQGEGSIRTANAAAVTIPPAPLFYRFLQATKHYFQTQEGGIESCVRLSTTDREELI